MKNSFSFLLSVAATIALSGCGHIMTSEKSNIQNGSHSQSSMISPVMSSTAEASEASKKEILTWWLLLAVRLMVGSLSPSFQV